MYCIVLQHECLSLFNTSILTISISLFFVSKETVLLCYPYGLQMPKGHINTHPRKTCYKCVSFTASLEIKLFKSSTLVKKHQLWSSGPIISNHSKKSVQVWKNGSLVKSACCSFRKPEFASQGQSQAHHHELQQIWHQENLCTFNVYKPHTILLLFNQ